MVARVCVCCIFNCISIGLCVRMCTKTAYKKAETHLPKIKKHIAYHDVLLVRMCLYMLQSSSSPLCMLVRWRSHNHRHHRRKRSTVAVSLPLTRSFTSELSQSDMETSGLFNNNSATDYDCSRWAMPCICLLVRSLAMTVTNTTTTATTTHISNLVSIQ